MEQAYAQALWRTIERGMDHKKAVRALQETLVAHGRSELMHKISRSFSRIAQREQQKSGLTLTVAREKDLARAKREAKEVLRELGATEVEFIVRLDEGMIGGWRAEGGGYLVDRSFKKYLLDMYNRSIS